MKNIKLPPPDALLATCTAVIAYITTVKTVVNSVVPLPIQKRMVSFILSRFANRNPKDLLFTIENRDFSGRKNPVYEDLMVYLGEKVRDRGNKIKVTREPTDKGLHLTIAMDDDVIDVFQGVTIKCKYCKGENSDPNKLYGYECIEMRCERKDRNFILETYIPYFEKQAVEIRDRTKLLSMYSNSTTHRWEKTILMHTSTFNTMALRQEDRTTLINDLERFMKRRDYYKKVGRAWKRGYLLYGPPGTGKSSLVAAIASHLKFDIYDLQLTAVQDDSILRKLLLGVSNSSVLVVEDIDRSVQLKPGPLEKEKEKEKEKGLSVAGILNSIDGIWSSCGEERIIIFTTNNKDAIDEALLRPGRMDMHIYMGHCCFDGFKTLASNYLDLEEHALFPEVEKLIQGEVITPAEVAEEFIKTDDSNLAMQNLVTLLRNRMS